MREREREGERERETERERESERETERERERHSGRECFWSVLVKVLGIRPDLFQTFPNRDEG